MSIPSMNEIRAALKVLQPVITKMVQETGCEPEECFRALAAHEGDQKRAVSWLVDPIDDDASGEE